ncbi:MAG: hypothetical protein IT480_19060 [Gammaproteobacteria bacterium]|nr:hypothetical protein [Gammaproteobacteria bacterium]
MASQPTQPKDAACAHAAARNDIARLLDILQMEIEASARTEPPDWALVAELQKVRHDLIGLVEFITGIDRESVEEFLADAE